MLIKSNSDGFVIKDLDEDILAKGSASPWHQVTTSAINKLRGTTIKSAGDILAVLGSHDTSKPKDMPIISGLQTSALKQIHLEKGVSEK